MTEIGWERGDGMQKKGHMSDLTNCSLDRLSVHGLCALPNWATGVRQYAYGQGNFNNFI